MFTHLYLSAQRQTKEGTYLEELLAQLPAITILLLWPKLYFLTLAKIKILAVLINNICLNIKILKSFLEVKLSTKRTFCIITTMSKFPLLYISIAHSQQ